MKKVTLSHLAIVRDAAMASQGTSPFDTCRISILLLYSTISLKLNSPEIPFAQPVFISFKIGLNFFHKHDTISAVCDIMFT